MLSLKDRYFLTVNSIESSDAYEHHSDLFDEGISILNNWIRKDDFSEFSFEEREALEEVFSIMDSSL